MIFEILTLFPRMVDSPLRESVIGKAREAGLVEVRVRDIRDHAEGKHRVCDGAPYGGGAGMVMKPEPLAAAIEAARAGLPEGARVVLLSPAGRLFTQAVARRYAGLPALALVCGRYEGVDERIVELGLVDEELSAGDYVLTGGEAAALCVVDAVARLRPGVLGNAASPADESFSEGLLEYPQYTRPPVFRGRAVPEVLVGGHHERVRRWRRREQLVRTRERRPDLWVKREIVREDEELLSEE